MNRAKNWPISNFTKKYEIKGQCADPSVGKGPNQYFGKHSETRDQYDRLPKLRMQS